MADGYFPSYGGEAIPPVVAIPYSPPLPASPPPTLAHPPPPDYPPPLLPLLNSPPPVTPPTPLPDYPPPPPPLPLLNSPPPVTPPTPLPDYPPPTLPPASPTSSLPPASPPPAPLLYLSPPPPTLPSLPPPPTPTPAIYASPPPRFATIPPPLPPPRHPPPSLPVPSPSPSPSNSPSITSPSSPPKLSPKLVHPTAKPHTEVNGGHSRPSVDSVPFGNGSEREGNSRQNNSVINSTAAATIAVVAGLVVLSFLGAAVWFVKRQRRPPMMPPNRFMHSPIGSSQMSASSFPRSPSTSLFKYTSGVSMQSPSDHGLGSSKLSFMYEDLASITNGFSTQNLLGQGGFGSVYRGRLPDGREVAVKQLKIGGAQGEREFKAEVEIISRVHHRHLVSLVGYCISDDHRLLVYDYVPNNSLHCHLHGKGRRVIDWAKRVKIAAGAARGIAYLHEDCHPRIIHRDIKSSNILLDHNFESQVSDFGLARSAVDACTHVTTRVMGTFGYLAPEYASSGKLTAKSDVYSFGVVLLELITGRKPVDICQPLGDESLVEWARPLMSQALESGDFGGLPDPRLENNFNEKEMFCMIEAAAACVRHSARMRPRMAQVVRALDNLAEEDLTNGVRPGYSEIFNSAQQSAEIREFQMMRFASQNYSNDTSRTTWRSRRDL